MLCADKQQQSVTVLFYHKNYKSTSSRLQMHPRDHAIHTDASKYTQMDGQLQDTMPFQNFTCQNNINYIFTVYIAMTVCHFHYM